MRIVRIYIYTLSIYSIQIVMDKLKRYKEIYHENDTSTIYFTVSRNGPYGIQWLRKQKDG